MVDSISDMLTRIRNAQAVGHKTVDFSYSRIKFELATTLDNEKYLGGVSKKGKGVDRRIEVVLKYKDDKGRIPFLHGLKRMSKPGQKLYITKKGLSQFIKERGTVILSTSQGIMTFKEAQKRGIGGEVLCKIW